MWRQRLEDTAVRQGKVNCSSEIQDVPRLANYGKSCMDSHSCICAILTPQLKVEENQLVDVFGEFGFHIDGLKSAQMWV